ncbi:baeRF2 domain-containing protein [Amycolatopsis solani]|uniref:Rv2629 family ribosome hibernation factor n=1 Tax=Amycolatopsis solani TaxID=3028615 RepID=UPI0025AF34A2|nr:Vms1/Ankzf1 family peptidyl-tRNA hydrolase [Amycolatopsis sp. MEP2-6]
MDQDQVKTVLTADGPFASVYLEDSHDTEDADRQLDVKLRDMAGELGEQGVDEATVEAVVSAIRDGDPPVGRSGRGVVAAGGQVLVDRRLAGPPAAEVARVSSLPYLLPFFSHAPAGIPYLLVTVDHRGADLVTHDRDGREVATETVEGEDAPLHKVRGGGMAHAGMQANVEETRDQNLERVAERVAATHPGLVLLVGEQQARRALHTKLPPAVQDVTRELSAGSRAPGASQEELEREIRTVLAEQRLRVLDELAERFRIGSGRADGLAVTGLAEVVGALAEANVDALLIGEPGDAEVRVGRNAGEIALDRDGLAAFGVEDGREERADEALPWAALASGASVTVMDERIDLKEGVGALLRHT